jgi:hypothetical protein
MESSFQSIYISFRCFRSRTFACGSLQQKKRLREQIMISLTELYQYIGFSDELLDQGLIKKKESLIKQVRWA